ncbi:MAG TPA: gfo/Idh/MocA family oxidoreductase [Verrucomicrobiales bacterium]|nr:dehydrogenase [Roseibacillus sp.]HBM77648.1 gfo/Idh/MocA family oxidoreductase [Verrucomicrobiales bacterium]HCQ40019.1 gfo/Idh/MocA family oxidoreductase [Verrucomicrobiales bacterium]|tara:strand:+ start:2951 stop:4075 length:1125 start_codon:yes stop_codon:yes gene_type:complete
MSEDDDYGLSAAKEVVEINPPKVNYRPRVPKSYRPKIAMIGTGGISEFHLKAYRKCGYEVAAFASRTRSKAEAKRDEFFPEAEVYDDYHAILERKDIEVLDITPHPADRIPIVKEALKAGKHVLSQKPFVLDLSDGEELIRIAEENGVKLAVNQNGRWAPHFSYLRNAVAEGVIGRVTSLDFNLQWDQTWIKGTSEFESIHHLILFDFAVHWFDIASQIMAGQEPTRVLASVVHYEEQVYQPPALAAVIIEYPGAQVRFSFNAHTTLGEEDVTTVVGTEGTLRSRGPGLNEQSEMEVYLKGGCCRVPLESCWFDAGFEGAMGELLCAIEEGRDPNNSATSNLKSLELCFAALASADTGQPVKVGSVRKVSAGPL